MIILLSREKLSWTTVDEVRNRTKQAVKKNRILLFHWRGGYLTKEVLKELLVVFDEEASVKGKQAYVSVNWPQAVIRVRFEDGLVRNRLRWKMRMRGKGSLEVRYA